MKYMIAALAALLIATGAPAQNMPGLSFQDTEGHNLSTQDIPKGKALMLVYFRSDCDHCTHTAQQLKTTAKAYPATIWMVSAETQPAIRMFEEMMDLYDISNLRVLRDYTESMHRWFDFSQLPFIVLYDKNRKQLKTFGELPSVTSVKKILAQK
ncbi:peroxiredoxin family protein [Taibaiella chishuiensis]|uniref:AhpC/TSA family protein n=1 Tax=Taibaiella chishuiensis TaxID=1434707 RepID=A0A2P8D412_9BACT|nr:redoxin domain-containing protein [Taibaiella chishuiensis]PSK91942.1 AhpC/TSA family protein [Taibaiella chishuiensis]